VDMERGPASWVQLRSYFELTVSTPVLKTDNTALVIRCADHTTSPLWAKVGTNFANKRRALGWYNYVACGLRSRSLFVCLFVCLFIILLVIQSSHRIIFWRVLKRQLSLNLVCRL
jgi:hypothetical protein